MTQHTTPPRLRIERRFDAALRLSQRWRTPWTLRSTGLALGPVLFLLTIGGPAPDDMPVEAQRTAAIALWMATWWLTRALPLHLTALLPLALFPLLGLRPVRETAPAYTSGVIFLFLGGFILAAGVQRWALHRRLARAVSPARERGGAFVLLSFMMATAFLSMWMSNTAAAMVMLPVAAEVVSQTTDGRVSERAGTAFMLGVAYAASIGGIATIIGSPPNAVFAGYAREVLDDPVSFVDWMLWGVPVSMAGLLLVWLFLTRVAYREVDGLRIVRPARNERAPLSPAEQRVLAVFGAVIALWLGRGVVGPLAATGLADEHIALAGAALLLLLPARGMSSERILHPRDLRGLPWGILVLFGGGIALAGGIESSGLAAWIGSQLSLLSTLPGVVVLLAVVGVTILLTELASNTATAAVLVPIAHGTAMVAGVPPIQAAVGVTTAASCAFMLPVATPPNAVVFASGRVSLGQMARAGVGLNVVLALMVTAAASLWLPIVW